MAEFLVTDPNTGQQLKLTGDSPPTEAELEEIFASPPEQPSFAEATGLGGVTRFSEGLFRGLKQARAGAEQLGAATEGFGDTLFGREPAPEREQRQQMLKSEIALRDIKIGELGIPGQAGGIIGEALPSTLLPGGPTGGLLRRVAGGVVADVAASIADPVREDETRLGNIERAAAFSSAFRVPGAAVSSGVKRLVNARSGQFADADIKELIDTANAEQISVFFDDVSKGSFARQASAAAEVFGRLGTGSGRIRQNEEALNAANRWLQRVSNDGDDFAEIVQTGVKRKLDIFKREASKKYDRVAREIGEEAGTVNTRLFDSASDAGIAAEGAKGTRANQAVIDFLQKFKDAPRGDFAAMIEFRSDMGKELRGFLSGDVPIAKSSIDSIIQATNALDEDMAKFADQHGARGSWRAANKFYQETVLQFKKGKLKSLLNEKSAANFDEQAAWKYLVQNTTNPKRARLMWQSLDTKAREAVRFGLIKEALEKATPSGGPFSPAEFAGFLEKRSPVVDQFFKGRSGDEIKGLIKVMRHIQQAGSIAINPPTGARAIPVGIAAISAADPSTGAVLLGSAVTLKGLFQTKAGRNLLLAANTASPGSQKFDEILENLTKVASRTSN
jgi:hypothetical protein